MTICKAVLVASLLACVSYCVLAENAAPSQPNVQPTTAGKFSSTASSAAKPLVTMTRTAGWGNGVLRSFVLNDDGSFTWTKGGKKELAPQTLVGKLSPEEIKSLTETLWAAGQGPAAEDKGYVEIEFVNADGKREKKDYSMPNAQPAASLLAMIDELAQKNGKAQAATSPATGPATNPAAVAATGPATQPAQISKDDAFKIAEETLKKRGTDPSAMAYHGTSLFTDRDGKQYWRVGWGPKQPPQVPGQPRAMIMGGQVNVLVSVETGETKMLLGM
jgi:hypothetical protein